jgi:hypothetical protein
MSFRSRVIARTRRSPLPPARAAPGGSGNARHLVLRPAVDRPGQIARTAFRLPPRSAVQNAGARDWQIWARLLLLSLSRHLSACMRWIRALAPGPREEPDPDGEADPQDADAYEEDPDSKHCLQGAPPNGRPVGGPILPDHDDRRSRAVKLCCRHRLPEPSAQRPPDRWHRTTRRETGRSGAAEGHIGGVTRQADRWRWVA